VLCVLCVLCAELGGSHSSRNHHRRRRLRRRHYTFLARQLSSATSDLTAHRVGDR